MRLVWWAVCVFVVADDSYVLMGGVMCGVLCCLDGVWVVLWMVLGWYLDAHSSVRQL